MKNKTHKHFLKDIQFIYGDKIKILNEYVNSRQLIKTKCTICNHEWIQRASKLIYRKNGCSKCNERNRFIKKIQKLYNNEINILGHYSKSRISIKVKSTTCKHEWYRTPSGLLLNEKCPICVWKKDADNKRKSHNQFIKDLQTIHSNKIISLSEYKGANKLIKVKCEKCAYKWLTKPHNLLTGCGCKKCAYRENGERLRKSHEEFAKELKVVSNSKIKALSKYKNIQTYIKIYCLICNHEWSASPKNLLHGYGCPKCNCNISKGSKKNRKMVRQKQDNV